MKQNVSKTLEEKVEKLRALMSIATDLESQRQWYVHFNDGVEVPIDSEEYESYEVARVKAYDELLEYIEKKLA